MCKWAFWFIQKLVYSQFISALTAYLVSCIVYNVGLDEKQRRKLDDEESQPANGNVTSNETQKSNISSVYPLIVIWIFIVLKAAWPSLSDRMGYRIEAVQHDVGAFLSKPWITRYFLGINCVVQPHLRFWPIICKAQITS